jgi:hypothetical protein
MYIRRPKTPYSVTLPDGRAMTRDDLPSPATQRWVASRKAAVVRGVQAGLLTQQEAMDIYHLTEEEFASWVYGVSAHGVCGLKTTQIQRFRPA